MILSALLLGLFQAPATWVVDDVLPPLSPDGGHMLYQIWPLAQGDLDGDGACEVIVELQDSILAWTGLEFRRGAWERRLLPLPGPVRGGLSYSSTMWRLLRTPSDPVLLGSSSLTNWKLATFSLGPNMHELARASRRLPYAVMRIGDIDGDGWDDVLYQDSNSATTGWAGVLSGADLSVIWEYTRTGEYYERPMSRQAPAPWPDLSGDGIPDVVAPWMVRDPLTGAWQQSIDALDGTDGSLLWNETGPESRGVNGSASMGPDVTGDGIADLAWANGDFMMGLSGADGARLWGFDPAVAFDPGAPTGYAYLKTLGPTMLTLIPEGRLDLVVPAVDDSPTFGVPSLYALGHFDPATGAFLGRAELPADLLPWYPDPVEYDGWFLQPLGDVDRDGLQEVGLYVRASSLLNGHGYHLATLSMRTLSVPEQVAVGAGVGFDAEVSIPSGANLPCRLVLSRAFDAAGGQLLQGWKSHLAPDPWLTRSLNASAMETTLDAQGRGTIHVPLPPDPNLVGTTLYTRAVVRTSPSDPTIWTLSTLGVTELLP